MLPDKDKIGVCLAATRTAIKVANPSIRIQIFPILFLDQMLMVLQDIKTVLTECHNGTAIVQIEKCRDL